MSDQQQQQQPREESTSLALMMVPATVEDATNPVELKFNSEANMNTDDKVFKRSGSDDEKSQTEIALETIKVDRVNEEDKLEIEDKKEDEHVGECVTDKVGEQVEGRNEAEEDNDCKREPDQLVEQPGLIIIGQSGADELEQEHKLDNESGIVEFREPYEQSEAKDESNGESEQIELGIETTDKQVVEAEELVAKQLASVMESVSPIGGAEQVEQPEQDALSNCSAINISSPTCSATTEQTLSVSISSASLELDLEGKGADVEPFSDHIVNQEGDDDCEERVCLENGSCNSDIDQDLGDEVEEEDDDDSLSDDFCTESASRQNLRRLKMDASEDVLVCELNRDSVNAARSLFKTLTRQREHKHHHQQVNSERRVIKSKQNNTIQRSGSLSDTPNDDEEDEEEDEEEEEEVGISEEINNLERFEESNSHHESLDNGVYDIKIIRRSGSSLSASGFRRTLVCSVSPTSQMGSNSDMSNQDGQPIYPIDDDEMLQCKTAFRENKRLIERQQENVSSNGDGLNNLSSKPSAPTEIGASSNWSSRNLNSFLPPNCAHCKQKLYPVDKMELGFTRTTLNIHRNCFKCQVCSTMLRLETYAAVDAKLYCPAHVRCATATR